MTNAPKIKSEKTNQEIGQSDRQIPRDDLIPLIIRRIGNDWGAQARIAHKAGISRPRLSMILNSKLSSEHAIPNPLLKAVGIRRSVTYYDISEEKDKE